MNLQVTTRCALLIAALLVLSGCATHTLGDALRGKGSGLSREYNSPVEKIWSVMPLVLSDLGLDLVDANREKGYFLAQRGLTILSYGENVAIFTQAVNQDRTHVEVVSKRAVERNIFATDWTDDILEKLEEKL